VSVAEAVAVAAAAADSVGLAENGRLMTVDEDGETKATTAGDDAPGSLTPAGGGRLANIAEYRGDKSPDSQRSFRGGACGSVPVQLPDVSFTK
jgi:hypothetical protein